MNLEGLARPFKKVSWRVGSTSKKDPNNPKGMALGYLDARDVMERLDDVVGAENWQAEYPFPGCCRIGIRIVWDDIEPEDYTDEEGKDHTIRMHNIKTGWVWKSNGAGETDFEGAKGQYSDAFKRAAVLWGIGRYLYDLPNAWVAIEPMGKSFRFTKQSTEELNSRYTAWANKIGVTHRFKTGEKDQIISQVRECLQNGDEHGLRQIVSEYKGAEEQMKFHGLFNSAERSAIKKLMGDTHD